MTDPRAVPPPSPATPLAAALGTVVLGTLLVDATRVWLLVIPFSFLLAALTAGTLLHRLTAGSSPMEPFGMPQTAVRIGTGVALLSFCATLCALAGAFQLAGGVTILFVALGLVITARTLLANRAAWALTPAVSGIALGVVWLIAWLWATIPPIFYDELEYHLVIPERALATGSLRTYPWVFFTLMPHASDLLLGWGLAVGGDLGARAMHWSFYVWGSLAAWGLLDALLRSRSCPWTAALAAGALAASPTFWFLGTLTFAEMSLAAALVTVACILADSEPHHRPWLSAGLLLGFAASVKLSGFVWVLAGLAATLTARWPARDVAFAGLIALLGGAPWWGRAARLTGNPVYPLGHSWLGDGGLWSDASQALVKADLPPSVFDLGLSGTLRLPWDLITHPERFGSASEAGLLAVCAILAVLLLPALARASGADRETRTLSNAAAVFVLLSGTAWAITSTTTRFLAPTLLLSTAVFLTMALSFRQTGVAVVLACLTLFGVRGTARFLEDHDRVFSSAAVALGREDPEAYASRLVDHYDAATFVRRHTPPDAKLLMIGEARPFYFKREAIAPSPFDRHPLQMWVQESSSPQDLASRLASQGITHVVLNTREFRRLHDKYGVLAFTGDRAEEWDRRLKALPGALRRLLDKHGVFVFEVPPAT